MGKQYLLSTESKTYLSFFLGTQEIGGGGVGRCGGSGPVQGKHSWDEKFFYG